jgi:hypothetical protein
MPANAALTKADLKETRAVAKVIRLLLAGGHTPRCTAR